MKKQATNQVETFTDKQAIETIIELGDMAIQIAVRDFLEGDIALNQTEQLRNALNFLDSELNELNEYTNKRLIKNRKSKKSKAVSRSRKVA